MTDQTGRVGGTARLASDAGLDAIVAIAPENFAHQTGMHIVTTRLIPLRQAFAVITREGRSTVAVCTIDRAQAEAESAIRDVRSYKEFAEQPMDMLADILVEHGCDRAGARVGIELTALPFASYRRLTLSLPYTEFVDSSDLLARQRAVKTPGEVSRLEHITGLTHDAVTVAMARARLGESERTMAGRICAGIIDRGAETIMHMVFGSGKRSRQAHPLADERIPTESQIIRFDVGGTFGAWMTDFARTYSTGNPTAVQKETYAKLALVQRETINIMRPGMIAEDVFVHCHDRFMAHGLDFWMPHVGHSFGLELHENPMLRAGDKTVLAPGMVFNVEPFVFDDVDSGYHLEDLVLITDGAPRILTMGLAPAKLPTIGEPPLV